MTAPTKPRFRPEDLLAMPDADRFELVDGELVEREMSQKSSWIGQRINRFVDNFVDESQLGYVFQSDMGLRIFGGSTLRFSDGCFVRRERLAPNGPTDAGYLTVAPDLVVEVVSPNDLAVVVDVKVKEYLAAGVQVVWVVYPASKSAHVFRADGTSSPIPEEGELKGESVLPGLTIPLSRVFPQPEPTPA